MSHDTNNPNKIAYWFLQAEKFHPDKVATLCLDAGANYEVATEVVNAVQKYVTAKTKMRDIKPLVFKFLSKKDPAAAQRLRCTDIFVRTSSENYERFDRKKVEESLMKETSIDRNLAKKISFFVEKFLIKNRLTFISAPLIREVVNYNLLTRGLEDIRSQYARIGMPVYEITNLIEMGSKENANLQYNPETIHKLIADTSFKEYALLKAIPCHAADLHLQGAIHIHDLDYFVLRPFCMSHDLRFFLKKGYRADGLGDHTATAGPAKHATVAILHAAKVLASSQTNCSGGQGYNWFNILIAPYLQKMSYKEIKQIAQMFIFEMSQMYVARGGQTVFSSIDISPGVPKVLENIPAVLPGGKIGKLTYGDFSEEARLFFNAIIDVFYEGDQYNKPFNFPKCEVQVRREDFIKYLPELTKVSRLSAKYGTAYYFVQQNYMPEYACYQCCSFMMPLSDLTEESDLLRGTVRGGALQVVTINLPRLAYESKGNDARLWELLRERMSIAKDIMIVKRDLMRKRISQGILPFLSQPIDEKGTPYLEVDKQSFEIGMIGLNEMLKAHIGEELHESKYAWQFGLKTIKMMSDTAIDLSKEDGLRLSISRTPAESAAHRLAAIDYRLFKDVAIVQGDIPKQQIYYTNSTHVRPSAKIPLFDRIKIEAAFHPLLTGGAMTHVWLGETPEVNALTEFTRKIVEKTLTAYFAYTTDLTFCKTCKTVTPQLSQNCLKCNSKHVEWYSRITGYYQRVSSWNRGKRQELLDRRRYLV